MPRVSKKDADAHDQLMDAASELADLISRSGIDIGEQEMEDLAIFLAKNGPAVREILKPAKRVWPVPPPHT
jgi:dsDNA-binding SOS-regulon protein